MFNENTYQEYLPSTLSLSLEEMEQLHQQMIAHIKNDEDALELYQGIIKQAIDYIRFRANWAIWDREHKINADESRTSCHNVLINKFNIFARYLQSQGHSVEWRETLGDENAHSCVRKRIGDFACYLVFVNALCER